MKIIQIFFIQFLLIIPKLSAVLDHYDFFYEKIYSSLRDEAPGIENFDGKNYDETTKSVIR